MRHDVANVNSTGLDNPYVALAAPFDAVARLNWTTPLGEFDATGTLVMSATGDFKLLTAAHNVDSEDDMGGDTPDGIIDAASFEIQFGDDVGVDGSSAFASVSVPASSVLVNPKWTNGDGIGLIPGASQYDLAVMTFSLSDVVGMLPDPMLVSPFGPTGLQGTMVGYGTWGTGDAPFEENAVDGVRRAAHNIIDLVGDPVDNPFNTGITVQTDFDSPTGDTSSLGGMTALALEGTTAGGDSGGPLLADFGSGLQIVGVLNGGFNPIGAGVPSEYGDRGIWATISDPMNRDFLVSAGVMLVPEPSSVLLVTLALAAVAVGRRLN